MKNPRITKKEHALLKGAMRRVFSRSELRRRVLDAAEIKHSDPKRPRVTRWVRCAECKLPTPRYLGVVDHIDPVVPVDVAFEDMLLHTVRDRLWCEEHNLQVLDKQCHEVKTKAERKERTAHKRGKKKK